MFILEADIQQVMRETGMEHLQARRHLECRQILRDRAQSAHVQLINSLIDRVVDVANAKPCGKVQPITSCVATEGLTTGDWMSSVKGVGNLPN